MKWTVTSEDGHPDYALLSSGTKLIAHGEGKASLFQTLARQHSEDTQTLMVKIAQLRTALSEMVRATHPKRCWQVPQNTYDRAIKTLKDTTQS